MQPCDIYVLALNWLRQLLALYNSVYQVFLTYTYMVMWATFPLILGLLRGGRHGTDGQTKGFKLL